MNIENPMVLDQEKYDAQMQPYETKRCDYCEELCPIDSITDYPDGSKICACCRKQYLLDNMEEKHFNDFILEHQQDYLLNWWFANLSEIEKIGILEEIYNRQMMLEKASGSTDLIEDRAAYCNASEDEFLYHVEWELMKHGK